MSFVEIRQKIHADGVIMRGRELILKCDVCDNTFVVNYGLSTMQRDIHVCSRKCQINAQRVGGILDIKKKNHFLAKYGVQNPSQIIAIKKQKQDTCMKNHGVAWPMQSASVRARSQETVQTCFGVANVSQSPDIKQKKIATCCENFSVENPAQADVVKGKIRQTCLKKYGVSHPQQSQVIQEKTRLTNIKRYNVPCVFQSHEIMQNVDRGEVAKKRHMTMKKNHTYCQSRAEDNFYLRLVEQFSVDDVKRQVRVNIWDIDFHIVTIDVYIQFDGIYWHGLNRSPDVIAKSLSSRDINIYETYMRDKMQNEWFSQNEMKLIRVREDANFDEILCRLIGTKA